MASLNPHLAVLRSDSLPWSEFCPAKKSKSPLSRIPLFAPCADCATHWGRSAGTLLTETGPNLPLRRRRHISPPLRMPFLRIRQTWAQTLSFRQSVSLCQGRAGVAAPKLPQGPSLSARQVRAAPTRKFAPIGCADLQWPLKLTTDPPNIDRCTKCQRS